MGQTSYHCAQDSNAVHTVLWDSSWLLPSLALISSDQTSEWEPHESTDFVLLTAVSPVTEAAADT